MSLPCLDYIIRSNVRSASAVVNLADRNRLARVDDEDLDAETLFTYLKLEKHIDKKVFFTTELTFESNMVVLNTNVLQRVKDTEKKMSLMNKSEKVGGEDEKAGNGLSTKEKKASESAGDADGQTRAFVYRRGTSKVLETKGLGINGAIIEENDSEREGTEEGAEGLEEEVSGCFRD